MNHIVYLINVDNSNICFQNCDSDKFKTFSNDLFSLYLNHCIHEFFVETFILFYFSIIISSKSEANHPRVDDYIDIYVKYVFVQSYNEMDKYFIRI